MPTGPSTNAANGTRLYGETDATGPLFSDFLNLALLSIDKLFNRLRAYKSSTQALTSSAAGVTGYDLTARSSLPGTWSAAAGTFTATVAATYKVQAQCGFAANATNTTSRATYIQKAAAATPTAFANVAGGIAYTTTSSTASDLALPLIAYVPLAVGDVLRVAASSGTNLNLVAASFEVELA